MYWLETKTRDYFWNILVLLWDRKISCRMLKKVKVDLKKVWFTHLLVGYIPLYWIILYAKEQRKSIRKTKLNS
jgi:hypothetical protein